MPFLTQGKTNWKYILIVVILSVVVGGGIWGYTKYFTKEIFFLTKFPETKKPEKIIKDETADWKTYRNTKYKYEVKYPKDWRVYEPIPNDWSVEFTSKSLDKHFSITVLEDEIYPASERRYPTFEDFLSIEREAKSSKCLAGLCVEAVFFKEVEIKLNNFTGVEHQVVYNSFLSEPGYHDGLITTYIPKNRDVFIIEFGRDRITETLIPPEDLTFYNRMLSTFRFLE